jgi:hypothetical protein
LLKKAPHGSGTMRAKLQKKPVRSVAMRNLFLVSMFLCSASAYATPVTWTLENVTFDDGGTAFGSYTYDAAANTFSSISITTTGTGGIFSGTFYEDACNVSSCHPDLQGLQVVFERLFAADDIENLFALRFEGPMTNSGGTLDLKVGPDCSVGSCEADFILRSRTVVSGSVSAVPVPAAVWLFCSALAGLSCFRRKKAA